MCFLLTGYAAPIGVPTPFDVVVHSGYKLTAKWGQPTGPNTGPLTIYTLKAYNSELPDIEPLQANYTPLPTRLGMFIS